MFTPLPPATLTRRVYHFFTVTLSIPPKYNRNGFIHTHLSSDGTKARFCVEMRSTMRHYARLDADRGPDMAALFVPGFFGHGDGPYCALLEQR